MNIFSHFTVFQRARIKLTLWYFLIILIITGSFSVGLYKLMTAELDRLQRMQKVRIDYLYQQNPEDNTQFFGRPQPVIRFIDPEIIEDSKRRILYTLLLIDLGILTASSAAAFVLAGKTLKPIQVMMDEQKRFITDSSHELRTPLTALRSELEVTLRDPKLGAKEAKQIMKSNLEEVISLQSLTDNLMRLTQFEKNNHLYTEIVSLHDSLEEAKRKTKVLAEVKKIEVEISGDDQYIHANKHTITELFVIFFDNAIKYSDQKKKVSASIKKLDHSVQVDITDEGIGIAKDEIPHLFERFYRADKARTRDDSSGFGLGLSIAKQIVDKYKGEIKVKSEIERGTTFSIILPIQIR